MMVRGSQSSNRLRASPLLYSPRLYKCGSQRSIRSYRAPAGEPVVGGGVIGSSIAYHLAQAGDASDVVVVEPDPTYEFAATPRATGGIRQLYTVPENIRMWQYGHEIYGQFETLMAVDGEPARIDFHRAGYLWLGWAKRTSTR